MSGILASKLFYINSELRSSGTSDNFTYSLSIPDNQKFDRVCVLQASIPQSYYIVASNSNTFTLIELGVPTTITIPIGNYNVNNFALVITTLLNSSSPNLWTYQMVYPLSVNNSNMGKFNFTVTGSGGSQPSLFFATEVHEQFGFNLNTTNTFVGGILTSSNVVSFVPETRIFIHSDLGINFDDGDSVLQEIYGNNSIPLSMMSYQLTTDPSAYSKKIRSGNDNFYRFWITDKNDTPIQLNGQDIMITLLAYRKDNFSELFRTYVQHQILSNDVASNSSNLNPEQ